MNLVCLDSHYFQWGVLAKSLESQKDKIGQASEFFKLLDETDATIIVPTPIITELLMGATAAEAVKIIGVIDANFRVAEFDVITAKIAADIWNTKKGQAEIEAFLKTGDSLRTKMKIDTMILATAITSNASILYTEDEGLAKLASGYIPTRKMPLASQTNFLDALDSPNAFAGQPEQLPTAQKGIVLPPVPPPPSVRQVGPVPQQPDSSEFQPPRPQDSPPPQK